MQRREILYITNYISATLEIVEISVNINEQNNACGEHVLVRKSNRLFTHKDGSRRISLWKALTNSIYERGEVKALTCIVFERHEPKTVPYNMCEEDMELMDPWCIKPRWGETTTKTQAKR